MDLPEIGQRSGHPWWPHKTGFECHGGNPKREGVCFILRVFLCYFSKFSCGCQSAQRRTVSAPPIVTYFMFLKILLFSKKRNLPP